MPDQTPAPQSDASLVNHASQLLENSQLRAENDRLDAEVFRQDAVITQLSDQLFDLREEYNEYRKAMYNRNSN